MGVSPLQKTRTSRSSAWVAYAAQEALLRTQTRSAMLAPRYPDLLEHTKVPGTLHRSVCLVSEGHQLIALVRSWSVDVSWLWSDPFLSVVSHWCFRGGRQWLQFRVIVSEDASCESQSRTNSEPVVIHLRFGSCARPEGHLWCSNSSLNMSEHHKLLKRSVRCAGPQKIRVRVTRVGPCLATLSDLSDIVDIIATVEKDVPWRANGAEPGSGWQWGAGIQFRHLR